MVVLVIGGYGQLGQAIQKTATNTNEITFIFATSQEIDITKKDTIEKAFSTHNPHYCINAAAYTAVDKAESEQEKAFEINVVGVKNIAEICLKHNTILIHISTDFVFDGLKEFPYTEKDIPNPTSVYGMTKRNGELAIETTLKKFYIIRTSWVYSEFGANFMKTMLRIAKERETISVVNDQIGTPTYAVDLAKCLIKIIKTNHNQPTTENYGIYHFSNEGYCSWYDFAKKIFELNQYTINIVAIPTESYPTPAKRPKYSVLNKTKIKQAFGIEIPNWETSLKEVTHNLKGT